MSTCVSRRIDSLRTLPAPTCSSRMLSERDGPDVLAPGSFVPFGRWSEPRKGGAGEHRAAAVERLLGAVAHARGGLGADEEGDDRHEVPGHDRQRDPLENPPPGRLRRLLARSGGLLLA